jgi:hypothetical protein
MHYFDIKYQKPIINLKSIKMKSFLINPECLSYKIVFTGGALPCDVEKDSVTGIEYSVRVTNWYSVGVIMATVALPISIVPSMLVNKHA